MQRLERLINLMAALLDAGRPLTRQEIGERVPGYSDEDTAFRRAFERDKDALRSMGVPLVTEPLDPHYPDHGDGYRIPPEEYQLPDPGLNPEELAALHVAASAVSLEGETGNDALWKLGGTLGRSDNEATTALPGSEHLPPLFDAVSKRRSLKLSYHGTERQLDPYRLSFRNGHWYVAGFDHTRDEERSFRVDRIEAINGVGEPAGFGAPASGQASRLPAPWQMGDDDPIEALLKVDADQADWMYTQLGPADRVVDKDADSTTFAISVISQGAFRSFVLGLLDRAEIVGPPELRDDIVTWLRSMAEPS